MTTITNPTTAFNDALDAHQEWLATGAARGQQLVMLDADLSHNHLAQANLARAHLAGVNFNHADLSKADLYRSVLASSTFVSANLQGAALARCNLDYADLSDANLRQTNLTSAEATEVQAARADFGAAMLSHSSWSGTDFAHANFQDATLAGIVLDEVNLTEADVRGASGLASLRATQVVMGEQTLSGDAAVQVLMALAAAERQVQPSHALTLSAAELAVILRISKLTPTQNLLQDLHLAESDLVAARKSLVTRGLLHSDDTLHADVRRALQTAAQPAAVLMGTYSKRNQAEQIRILSLDAASLISNWVDSKGSHHFETYAPEQLRAVAWQIFSAYAGSMTNQTTTPTTLSSVESALQTATETFLLAAARAGATQTAVSWFMSAGQLWLTRAPAPTQDATQRASRPEVAQAVFDLCAALFV